LKLPAHSALDCAHLSLVRFMVVARKVKKTVENQAPNIGVECENGRPPGLLVRGLGGNQNVAQIISTTPERQDIRRLVDMPEAKIIGVHRLVADEYHAEGSLRPAQLLHKAGKKAANTARINTMFPLMVQ